MILAIGRAARFSPNSVGKDTAIFSCVCGRLRQSGHTVVMVGEDEPWPDCDADAYVTMGRSESTIERLAEAERKGRVVVNTAESIALCCNRSKLNAILYESGVSVPSDKGANGYWLKRGDCVAQRQGDVRYVPDERSLKEAFDEMRFEGMASIVVQAHILGDLVKFYGVRGTPFFRAYYPGDDGQTKFGDEQVNGKPHHYIYNKVGLRDMAEEASRITGVDVYGGDCIVAPDGTLTLIDFNDWPSFSRCRDDAAEAIAKLIERKITKTSGNRVLTQTRKEEI